MIMSKFDYRSISKAQAEKVKKTEAKKIHAEKDKGKQKENPQDDLVPLPPPVTTDVTIREDLCLLVGVLRRGNGWSRYRWLFLSS